MTKKPLKTTGMINVKMVNPSHPQSHSFSGKSPCWCGKHHYLCDVCRVDCTAGTTAGPAYSDSSGTRCEACHAIWTRLRSALTPNNMADVETLLLGLTMVVKIDNVSQDHVDRARSMMRLGSEHVGALRRAAGKE